MSPGATPPTVREVTETVGSPSMSSSLDHQHQQRQQQQETHNDTIDAVHLDDNNGGHDSVSDINDINQCTNDDENLDINHRQHHLPVWKYIVSYCCELTGFFDRNERCVKTNVYEKFLLIFHTYKKDSMLWAVMNFNSI
jgi:hypothetical protein